MRVPEEPERPIAWKVIAADTPVVSSDGETVGAITEVLGAEDIFHGIVVSGGTLKSDVEIPADAVTEITTQQVRIALPAEEVRQLPPFEPEQSFRLGITGLLQRLGWVSDHEEDEPTL